MAWLAIDKGKEIIFDLDENRKDGCKYSFIELPHGTIKKLTGKKTITEPIKLEQ